MDTKPESSFSGRTRERKTQPKVLWANKIAATVITIGGISTVLAVTLVCVFLVSVAIPVFFPSKITGPGLYEKETRLGDGDLPLQRLVVNEYQTMSVSVTRSGGLIVSHLRDGEVILLKPLFGDRVPNDVRFVGDTFVGGFDDGTIQTGKLTFTTNYVEPSEVPSEVRTALREGSVTFRDGVLELTPENQYRLQTVAIEVNDPAMLEAGASIERVDISLKLDSPVIAAVSSTRTLHLKEIDSRYNMMTGKTVIQLFGGSLKLDSKEEELPEYVRLAGLGDNMFLGWPDGRLIRVDTRRATDMSVMEEVNLLTDGRGEITLVEFLVGKTSLVVGDDLGNISVWFRIKPAGADTVDGALLVRAHDLAPVPGKVSAFAASKLSRQIAVADDRGNINLYYVTNRRKLGELKESTLAGTVYGMALSPKDDGLFAWGPEGYYKWELDIPHPEINLQQVFGKVWYEGYNGPEHVWQSSSGTDDFEAKYGLMPLIFGTIKATVYSLLIGVPLAIMAALYTSEIMQPKLRAKVKPTIEMMASLPSVVLGFLAALVIAPAVEDHVPALLASFVVIPFSLLLGAHLWQLLSHNWAARMSPLRIPAMLLFLWVGFILSGWVGPWTENFFFLGDIKLWLSTREGTGIGGWMLLLMPLSGVFVMYANARWVTPVMKRRFVSVARLTYTLADFGRFLLSTLTAFLLAWILSSLLSVIGLDPRGSYIDTYVQRNALIVGFIMGFAIIPIIYTLCEDALSAVPETLRAASLGAGATPWQTATRIIIPTAASGFFSAVMIGFGRAVGETMIVLMAAGNTAVMEWNMFNGFRTLSANIAVELPEAVKDGTHYRMLYLAALSLFIMTFVLNSLAETVRQRFRKRAFEL
ncbi:MAG: ABC transporter permease subunit [Kiritimatiellia bacterium]